MAFIDKSDILKTLPHITDVVKIYKNDNVNDGAFCNAQFLRQYIDGSWILTIRADYNTFKIPLQQHQALALINNESGHYFDCNVVNHTK